jgi:D-alanyl-D-alanine carboxypeptidase/D-alanyl-D-alanine-endopeptidase (penicillin-binding protein 4)
MLNCCNRKTKSVLGATTLWGKPIVAFGLFCLLLSGCSHQPHTSPSIQPPSLAQIQQQLAAAGLPADALGLVMVPLHRPEQSVSYRADIAMAPASTMKLITTSVALKELGPDWSGTSAFFIHPSDQAELAQGGNSLQHPLYLYGGADTDLDYGVLTDMLRQLYELGVRHLHGGVQLDRSLFSPERSDLLGAAFDQSPRSYYNHQPDAFDLAQNMQQLTVTSDQSSLNILLQPTWDGLLLDWSAVKLMDKPCGKTDFNQWQMESERLPSQVNQHQVLLRFRGEFAKGCQQQQWLSVIDRDQLLPLAIQTLWLRQGKPKDPTSLNKRFAIGPKPTESELLVQHSSRPLRELLQRVNKQSDNGLTRLLFLQMGAIDPRQTFALPNDAATNQQRAIQKIQQYLAARHIDDHSLSLDNGSGLSRTERISPLLLAQLLQSHWQSPESYELIGSLPLAAVDGTLKNRFVNQSAAGKARLKTGTLRDVTALAGYVWDAQQRPWIWVSFINHPDAITRGKPLLDQWVNQLAASQ